MVDEPGGEPRVAMLETIREFAADRLDARPDRSPRGLDAAHAVYFAESGRPAAGRGLTGTQREAALTELGADVANLRLRLGVSGWPSATSSGSSQLVGPLLILDDAHGWYLDTVGLTAGHARRP